MIPALLLALIQTPAPEPGGLDTFAWTFMLVSITAVTSLTVWCFSQIVRGKEHFDPDGTGPRKPPVPGEVDRGG